MASQNVGVVIGQSGGPTAVINQSLVGCTEVLKGSGGLGRILGARHGVRGIVEGQFADLGALTSDRLERIAATPSSGLGSSRDKPDEAYGQRVLEALAKAGVGYFFYIGGNDSSDTCRIVSQQARKAGSDLRCFHIPKTIDNDLVCNDHTPGFGSAARFVACAFMGDDLDNRALPGIKINVVMGRHAGFLTAASILGRKGDSDGPHLVYVPEEPFDTEKFLADVERVYARLGRCLIAVSEGIHDASGKAIAAILAQQSGRDLERDAHGNVQLSGTGALGDFLTDFLKKRMGKKPRLRADTFGYMQRSFAGCFSATDATEARAVGRKAAELALAGETSGSVVIRRVSSKPYRVEYGRVDLEEVAAKTRHLEEAFRIGGNNIAESFKEYALPLVGPLPEVETF